MSRAAASPAFLTHAPRYLWRFGRFILVAFLGFVLLLMLFEEKLIFIPTEFDGSRYWHPVGYQFEDIYFQSDDGTRLHGWYFPHKSPRAIVLFSHGNAGNVTHRADIGDRLQSMGLSVFMYDYRGYGRSEGSPNEQGVLADARAARRQIAQLAEVDEKDIVQMGRSLGGAVAVDLAAYDGARGLILESTFSSIPDVAACQFPWLPVRRLMRTRLESISKIRLYQGPILQSHGIDDRTIPFHLGERLFAAANTDNGHFAEFFTIRSGDHNDPQPDGYYRLLSDFIQQLP
ncbi:MAG: alpha/beta hydrolase [Pirellulales bacterium]